MIIIMSPTKTFKDNLSARQFNIESMIFPKEIKELVTILKSYDIPEIMDIMKVSKALGEATYEKYESFERDTRGWEAIYYFYGEAFKGLDAATLNKDDLAFCNDKLLILSGLYGILKPLDIMKPYRLEMGTKLDNPFGRDLYGYWKKRLTDYVKESLEKTSGEKVLVNLASDEYSKSLDLNHINGLYKVVTIGFKENKDGKYKTIGTYAKKARGIMVRYILKNRIDSVDGIKGFNEEGYRFSEEQSDNENLIFIR